MRVDLSRKTGNIIGLWEVDLLKSIRRKLGVDGLHFPRFFDQDLKTVWQKFVETEIAAQLLQHVHGDMLLALSFVSSMLNQGLNPFANNAHSVDLLTYDKKIVERVYKSYHDSLSNLLSRLGLFRYLRIKKHSLSSIRASYNNTFISAYIGYTIVGTLVLDQKKIDKKQGIDPILYKLQPLFEQNGISLQKLLDKNNLDSTTVLLNHVPVESFVRIRKNNEGISLYCARSSDDKIVLKYILYVDKILFYGNAEHKLLKALELMWSKHIKKL